MSHKILNINITSESSVGVHAKVEFEKPKFFGGTQKYTENFFLEYIFIQGKRTLANNATHVDTGQGYWRGCYKYTDMIATLIKHIMEVTTPEGRKDGAIKIK